jgi:hypothetical protein
MIIINNNKIVTTPPPPFTLYLQVHNACLDGCKGLLEAQEGERFTWDVKGIAAMHDTTPHTARQGISHLLTSCTCQTDIEEARLGAGCNE